MIRGREEHVQLSELCPVCVCVSTEAEDIQPTAAAAAVVSSLVLYHSWNIGKVPSRWKGVDGEEEGGRERKNREHSSLTMIDKDEMM